MLPSILKSALRSLLRHKILSLINIISLSIGISASLVIYLIVHQEFNYDKFEAAGERIYRVVTRIDYPDMTMYNPGIEVPAAKAIPQEVSQVELATHIITTNGPTITVQGNGEKNPQVFKHQQEVVFVDNNYFRFLHYRWLAGSASTALSEPFSVVLTDRRAQLYFPGLPPSAVISKHLTYDDSITISVSGVVADLNEITDFRFQDFISIATVEQTKLRDRWAYSEWGSVNSSSQLFVRLSPAADPKEVERQIADLRKRHADANDPHTKTLHYLQPLTDIHLDPRYAPFDNRSQGSRPVLYGLMVIASFLVFLGSMNFINLATAQAVEKAKEIGIRKALGSSRALLLLQFLGESFLLTCIAAIVSLAIGQVLLQQFGSFIPEGIAPASILSPRVAVFLVLLVASVSVLSGLYPALVLSRLRPSAILRNQAFAGRPSTRSAFVRKSLTIIQFAVAQVLIIATIVVERQILYSLTMDLGYRRDAIVWFRVPLGPLMGQWTASRRPGDAKGIALVEQLKGIPGITDVSLGGPPPASSSTSSSVVKVDNGRKLVETMVEMKTADPAYFGLYGMKLIAGRNLQKSDTTREYVINETFAKFLGFADPHDALGRIVQTYVRCPIVGVLADFHTKSTHVPIKPLAYSAASSDSYVLHLALDRGDPSSWSITLGRVEKVFQTLFPGSEFTPHFFDESVAEFYRKDQNTLFLLQWAAGLAMIISCLGLLGLAVHAISSRTKEIGVRKVLGASVPDIVALVSKEFLTLVVLATAIAAPIGWWAMRSWLDDFAYRMEMNWWIIPLAGGVAVALAFLTISAQAVRAAVANPVKALRYE